jgi:NH3-dependent NAD+ synthetase
MGHARVVDGAALGLSAVVDSALAVQLHQRELDALPAILTSSTRERSLATVDHSENPRGWIA